MRIAMVAACPFPANHGTPGAIRELSLHLGRLGHKVHIVTYPQHDATPIGGVQIHRTAGRTKQTDLITIGPSLQRLKFDARLVPLLIRVIRRYDIEIIHSHNYEATIAGAIAKWVTGRPLVYTGINSMADELPTYRFIRPDRLARGLGKILDHSVPRCADVVTVLSQGLKTYLGGLGLCEDRMIVVPPGVETQMFADGDGASVRGRYRISATTPVVAYTGALEAFQRVDILFDAMAEVVKRHPDVILLIVVNIRNEAAEATLKVHAARLGFASNVVFTDPVPLHELSDHLAAADVAVVPRPSGHSFPVKLLNYMAAGKAIVCAASSAGTLSHLDSGYVARDHDAADMADGIAWLITDPVARAKLGRNALAAARAKFDWPALAGGVAALYRQALSHGRIDPERLPPILRGSSQS